MAARHVAYSGARFLLVMLLPLLSGCGYGEISPTAYQYAKGLYAICNRRAADRLESVRQDIESARNDGEISHHEADWLLEIIADGQQQRWDAGAHAAREIMEAQIR